MTVNFQQLAVTGVQSLQPYQPGKPIDELARELGLNEADIVKLASNENPLGPQSESIGGGAGSADGYDPVPGRCRFCAEKSLV